MTFTRWEITTTVCRDSIWAMGVAARVAGCTLCMKAIDEDTTDTEAKAMAIRTSTPAAVDILTDEMPMFDSYLCKLKGGMHD